MAPKFSSQYAAEKAVLDRALASNGGRYRLDTPGKAIHWRQRCYQMRTRLRNEINTGNEGVPLATKYDPISLRPDPADPCVMIIEVGIPKGEFTPGPAVPDEWIQGEILPDPLEAEALALAGRLLK